MTKSPAQNDSSITVVDLSSTISLAQEQASAEQTESIDISRAMNTIHEEASGYRRDYHIEGRNSHTVNEEDVVCPNFCPPQQTMTNRQQLQLHVISGSATIPQHLSILTNQQQDQEQSVCRESTTNSSPVPYSVCCSFNSTDSCQCEQSDHYHHPCHHCYPSSPAKRTENHSKNQQRNRRKSQLSHYSIATTHRANLPPPNNSINVHKSAPLIDILDGGNCQDTSSTAATDSDIDNDTPKSCCCCCCLYFCFSDRRQKQVASTRVTKKKRKSHKRLAVFVLFIFFILGAFAAFFCWPRTPRIILGEGSANSVSGPPDWWSGQQQQQQHSSNLLDLPARPSMRATWQLNVTIDNRDNWIPTHFNSIDFALVDTLTLAKFATATFPPADSSLKLFPLSPGTTTTLTLTFQVYYQAVDKSDPTFQNLYNSCGPIDNNSKEKRPALNVLLKVYFHIFGISWVPTVTAAPYKGGILCPVQ